MKRPEYRIGFSEDLHRLVEGRKLILGGVEIPFSRGLEGHSDADVIYHVAAESMLGALALGDLGTHFSPQDLANKDLNSSEIVRYTLRLIKAAGYQVNNIDISVVLEQPKLSKYIEEMRKNLANLLEISTEFVSIKATTKEGQDSVGRGEAIEAFAIILLRSSYV